MLLKHYGLKVRTSRLGMDNQCFGNNLLSTNTLQRMLRQGYRCWRHPSQYDLLMLLWFYRLLMTTHMTMGITETTTTLPKGFCRRAAAAPATASAVFNIMGFFPLQQRRHNGLHHRCSNDDDVEKVPKLLAILCRLLATEPNSFAHDTGCLPPPATPLYRQSRKEQEPVFCCWAPKN